MTLSGLTDGTVDFLTAVELLSLLVLVLLVALLVYAISVVRDLAVLVDALVRRTHTRVRW